MQQKPTNKPSLKPVWHDERPRKQTPSIKPLDFHPKHKWRAMESHLRSLRYLKEHGQSAAVDVRPEDLPKLRAIHGTAHQL